jgi:ribonuclease VapC
MIAVDTSALLAVLLREKKYQDCIDAMGNEKDLMISAGTLSEAHLVAGLRNVSGKLAEVVGSLPLHVVPVTGEVARRIGEIYQLWGRGRHPAALNFGDCFAYDTAKTHACPLLYVGDDFRKTDLQSVLV